MTLRELAAKNLDSLFGEEVNVADISIKRLIDTFEEFAAHVAGRAYQAGHKDGDKGVYKVANYIKKIKQSAL
jgi:hypothetical protein